MSEAEIISHDEPAPQPSEPITDSSIKKFGLDLMGNDGSENPSDYIAERKAQDAEERGEDIDGNAVKRKERGERYQRAVKAAQANGAEQPTPTYDAYTAADTSQQFQ